MGRDYIIGAFLSLSFLLVQTGHQQALADNESDRQNVISVRIGQYSTFLDRSWKTNAHYSFYEPVSNSYINGFYNVDGVSEGEKSDQLAYGISHVYKRYQRICTRVEYSYLRESHIVYDYDKNRSPYIQFADEKWKYSIHRVIITPQIYIPIIPYEVDLFVGAGISLVAITHPKIQKTPTSSEVTISTSEENRYELGGTVFPVLGCEFIIFRTVGFSIEARYHFGRTLDENEKMWAQTEQQEIRGDFHSDTIWYTKLNGPEVVWSVCFYW
jgi:hypothetical protein